MNKLSTEQRAKILHMLCEGSSVRSIISYFVGGRDGDCAAWFIDNLAVRLANRVQLTSDGHKAYLDAVEGAFGADIDYAMLNKIYGASPESAKGRYGPAECIGVTKAADRRKARSQARLDVLCRAQQPNSEDAQSALHSPDERLLEEIRKPRLLGRPVRHVLQFCQGSFDIAHVPRDGGWRQQDALGDRRYRETC